MKNAKTDVLKALAVLSNYDWYKVTQITDDGEQILYSAGLFPEDDGATIKSVRVFATPFYMNGFERVTAKAENLFEFNMFGGAKCIIEGENRGFAELSSRVMRRAFRYTDDLAYPAFINTAWTQYNKEEGTLILVIDPNLFGELPLAAYTQIEQLINYRLYGHEVSGNRTVCFKCKVHEPYKKIYADVFDLEKCAPANCAAPHIMQFNENLAHSMKEKEVERYLALWELAQQLYNEMAAE